MKFTSTVIVSVLAAFVAAEPVVDPLTVTSLSPAQVSIPSYTRAQSVELTRNTVFCIRQRG